MTSLAKPPTAKTAPSPDVRGRILTIATALLAKGGREALTTRAVALAAGIQQPTLYRLFGDKSGLLDAVAEQGLAAYVAQKTNTPTNADPLTDFRGGWDRHVSFGLTHPALFTIIWGNPDPRRLSPAAKAGHAALQRKIHALATAGLLCVSEEHAVSLAHATCTGTVLALLDVPEHCRDTELPIIAREAVIAAITQAKLPLERPKVGSAAITLHALLDQTATLTPGERHLMGELLNRIAKEASS